MDTWRVMREEIPDLFHPGAEPKVITHAFNRVTQQPAHPVTGTRSPRVDEYWTGSHHGETCPTCVKKVGRHPKG